MQDIVLAVDTDEATSTQLREDLTKVIRPMERAAGVTVESR